MPLRIPRAPLSALVLTLIAGAVPAAAAASPVRVVVAIPPLAWFVEQVAGDLADVAVLLGPGDSPHTFEPTPRQMAQLAEADLYLAAGVPFERALGPRIAAMPGGPRTAGPLPGAFAGDPGGHDHDHGLDPHVWLAPAGAAAIGDTVAAALLRLRPQAAQRIAAGRRDLQARIDVVDAAVRVRLQDCCGSTFVVFHPAFGHFAAAYGLEQVAIEDGGHEPGAKHLAAVIDLARARGVRAVVVQPQFSRRAADAVAATIGVPVVVLDPLARDWDANLEQVAATLAAVSGAPDRREDQP